MDSKKAYEQIKTILEHGMMAELELSDGKRRVAYFLYEDGNIGMSEEGDNLQECYNFMNGMSWGGISVGSWVRDE